MERAAPWPADASDCRASNPTRDNVFRDLSSCVWGSHSQIRNAWEIARQAEVSHTKLAAAGGNRGSLPSEPLFGMRCLELGCGVSNAPKPIARRSGGQALRGQFHRLSSFGHTGHMVQMPQPPTLSDIKPAIERHEDSVSAPQTATLHASGARRSRAQSAPAHRRCPAAILLRQAVAPVGR